MDNEELEHTDWCALALDHDGRCESAAAVEAMRRRIGTGEGDALIAEAGQVPRTAAATAARIRGRLDRQAEELRGAGWVVVTPEEIAILPRDEFGCLLMQVDPPRPAGVERHTFDVPGCPHMPACASYCPAVTHTFERPGLKFARRCPECKALDDTPHLDGCSRQTWEPEDEARENALRDAD